MCASGAINATSLVMLLLHQAWAIGKVTLAPILLLVQTDLGKTF